MTFGEAHPETYGEVSKETAFAILDAFVIEAGGNFIDTANIYRDGQSEEWLGEWMKARKVRDQLVLATKYTSAYQAHHKDFIQANFSGNGTKSMRASLEASLEKLQTTYVDLFYLHWWDYSVSVPELMHGLNDLVVSGKVTYLGISDTPAWIVAKANQYARDHGLRQFVVYQGMWNASMRDFERDIIPMCRDEGMGICPYGVLNQGRFQTEEGFKQREKHNPGRNLIQTTQHDKDVSRVLEKIANTEGKGILDIALGYVFHKTPYVFPIVGARKVEHIKASIEGHRTLLTPETIQKVDEAYVFDPGFPHSFLSGTLMSGASAKGAYGPADVVLTKSAGAEFDWVEAPKPIL